MPDALPAAIRKALIDEAWRHQRPDGSWTIDSLGAWKEHPQAPKSAGNSNYATGLTAYVLQSAGVPRSDARLKRALDWLQSKQDPKEGYWDGESMNKAYPADSMMALFMRDAATSFAAMALLENDRP